MAGDTVLEARALVPACALACVAAFDPIRSVGLNIAKYRQIKSNLEYSISKLSLIWRFVVIIVPLS
jgi:hypothetical protein